uniref:tRNA-5-taurinomethyluridine 2-sulfurtransferase n=1 Tax=Dunaliella tertiolecta TaxID=3047 RepID=A0A7S3R6C2_DUNTE
MRGLGVAVGAMRLRSWGLGQAIGCLGQVSISALSSSKDVPPMLSLQSPASVVRMPFRSVHSLGHSFPNARGCMPSSPLGQLLTALGSHGGQAPLLADPLANQLAVHVSAFGAPPSALSAGSMGAAGARHLTTTSSSNCRSSRSISGSSHSSSSSGRSAVPACVRAARGQRLRVAVAVSGGVDSAVAALLLVRAGHDVFGVFMRNWDPREEDVSAHEAVSPAAIKAMPPTGGHLRVGQGAVPTSAAALTRGQQTCVDAEARAAAAVCRALGIPFHEVDFVRQYWGQVFSDFIDTYRKGGTPNPDLACNRNIKFGELLTAAKRLGAEAIATGHYAQLLAEDGDISSSSSGGGGGSRQSTRVLLLQGIDPGKDQSYFLAAVPQEALLHCLFPIGHLLKSQVCNYAAEAGLAALMQGQRSSRGICFVGERRSFGAFMAQYVEPVPGQFVDVETRKALGPCDDILAFTPGQRARIPGSSKGAWWSPTTVAICGGRLCHARQTTRTGGS